MSHPAAFSFPRFEVSEHTPDATPANGHAFDGEIRNGVAEERVSPDGFSSMQGRPAGPAVPPDAVGTMSEGFLQPDTSERAIDSRRSSINDIVLPMPKLPRPPREKFRAAALSVVFFRRFFLTTFRRADNLCETCAGLELNRDKFIIQDHSFDRNQQAYLSNSSARLRRSNTNFPLGSSSGKVHLGRASSILRRSTRCPFCHLVICSLKYDPRLLRTITKEDSGITCNVSWQVDGREILNTEERHYRTRPRTRRIRLQWSKPSVADAYLVLRAPEASYKYGPSKQSWDFESLFLGRSIKSAAQNTALIRSWLNLCDTHHDQICESDRGRKFEDMVSQSYFGVIDVHEMRLTSLPKDSKYVALSYVWGEGERYKTTLGNVESHKQPGGLEKVAYQFPRVISDSVRLVRSLGERYLWVDSLCIVQDSDFSWSLNSSVMDQVYGNAYFTICAADGVNAKDALKAITPEERQIRQYIETCGEDLDLMVSHSAESYIDRSKWNTRAWTFQERLLSKRCLIFAEGRVFFQCRSTAMSEDIVSEKESACWSIELVQAPLQLLQGLHSRAFQVYMTCVSLYTARVLTRPKDILAAFNGMANLLGHAMESPLIWGLPSSHFDLAMLWQPAASLRRREPLNKEEEANFQGAVFPSWSWCGWMGRKNPKDCPPKLFYNEKMLQGCLSNAHQWLAEHTWISWFIRDGHGDLRPIWSSDSCSMLHDKIELRWRGYGYPNPLAGTNTENLDSCGRTVPESLRDKYRTSFFRTLPHYPFRVSFAQNPIKTAAPGDDKVFLQFWTWSAILKVYPTYQSPGSTLGEGLCRWDITDYTGDWCGTIVVDEAWIAEKGVQPGDEFEFLAMSDAKNFSDEENDTWTYYIPKERDQSEWDLYYVLLVEHKGSIAHRVGLGKVFQEAFSNSCLPGLEWKEIILE